MKDIPVSRPDSRRRGFLAVLSGLLAFAALRSRGDDPLPELEHKPRELALKEADFYRPHDLAG